jgi:hypothetical protein
MEVTVNKHSFRKLATVGAAAALSLQLLAGVASAAVPDADASVATAYNFANGGYAGFSTTLSYNDGSTLAKLYLEADITGASTTVDKPVPVLIATKNGNAVNGCSVVIAQTDPILSVKCTFKTARFGDVYVVKFGVVPASATASVSTLPKWSSTGYVTGGNSSHGDFWSPAAPLTSTGSTSPDLAAGFGNLTLTTKSDFASNNQYAKLQNLPTGVYASVDDNSGGVVDGFAAILLSVNDGGPATFQLLITYPNGVGAPDYFTHVSAGYPTATYYACAKNAPKVNCFDWSNKANTITLYLTHNGSIRRSG